MTVKPGPDTTGTGRGAPRLVGQPGRFDLSLTVRLDNPEPLLAEHDLPLSPFAACHHSMP